MGSSFSTSAFEVGLLLGPDLFSRVLSSFLVPLQAVSFFHMATITFSNFIFLPNLLPDLLINWIAHGNLRVVCKFELAAFPFKFFLDFSRWCHPLALSQKLGVILNAYLSVTLHTQPNVKHKRIDDNSLIHQIPSVPLSEYYFLFPSCHHHHSWIHSNSPLTGLFTFNFPTLPIQGILFLPSL